MIRFLHQILLALKTHKAIFLSVSFTGKSTTWLTEFLFRWFVHFESSWSGNNVFILPSNFWKEVWHWSFQQPTWGPQKFFITPRRQDEFSDHKKLGKTLQMTFANFPKSRMTSLNIGSTRTCWPELVNSQTNMVWCLF